MRKRNFKNLQFTRPDDSVLIKEFGRDIMVRFQLTGIAVKHFFKIIRQ